MPFSKCSNYGNYGHDCHIDDDSDENDGSKDKIALHQQVS